VKQLVVTVKISVHWQQQQPPVVISNHM